MATQKDILLVTLNATYFHAAFGLRYLKANLKELEPTSEICEFTCGENLMDIAEKLLSEKPRMIGFGVYIWNAKESLELVQILKTLSPQTLIVLGGPEVSFEQEAQQICTIADYVVCGEAEELFYSLCDKIFNQNIYPAEKIIRGAVPDLETMVLPYSLYTDKDIEHRVIYVEASRGCPFKCEFCLSSLDEKVRAFALDPFLAEMDVLIGRGVRQFKFVDRTFNLNIQTSIKIMEFFLERISLGLFIHFELIPDRLPDELKEIIKLFPRGSLQFEIGVQTLNPEVEKHISRRQNHEKLKANFQFLKKETEVHTHADLIVGLPGETLKSFASNFDTLYALKPDEIQVGILKRLRGTPLIRHDGEFQMKYQAFPPYSILCNSTMDFKTIQRMQRFAKFWDLVANSGNFKETVKLIEKNAPVSIFEEYLSLSDYLSTRHLKRHSIALLSLVESIWYYLKEVKNLSVEDVSVALIEDYSIRGKRDIPRFIKEADEKFEDKLRVPMVRKIASPKRQARHHQSPQLVL